MDVVKNKKGELAAAACPLGSHWLGGEELRRSLSPGHPGPGEKRHFALIWPLLPPAWGWITSRPEKTKNGVDRGEVMAYIPPPFEASRGGAAR
ncbi:hypothetical protein GCM10008941_34160 [Rhizomicrobium palustre]